MASAIVCTLNKNINKRYIKDLSDQVTFSSCILPSIISGGR